jgi:hypothetical protein
MIADQMAFLVDSADQFLAGLRLLAHDEEGRLHPIPLQGIQDQGRIGLGWAIIEGEGNSLLFSPALIEDRTEEATVGSKGPIKPSAEMDEHGQPQRHLGRSWSPDQDGRKAQQEDPRFA